MKHMLGSVALGAALMVAIAGCGAAATPSPPNATTAASSSAVPTSVTATAGSSTLATASAPTSLSSLPAIFSNHADPALEALLPATVSGTTLQRYSLKLSSVLDAGGNRPVVAAFLAGINKTEADATVAFALDPTGALPGGIQAYKVTGANTAALLAGIVSLEQSVLGTSATTRQGTVGGKAVTIVSRGTGVNDTEWIYARGDVVFVVKSDSEARAAAFLQALP